MSPIPVPPLAVLYAALLAHPDVEAVDVHARGAARTFTARSVRVVVTRLSGGGRVAGDGATLSEALAEALSELTSVSA